MYPFFIMRCKIISYFVMHQIFWYLFEYKFHIKNLKIITIY